MTTVIPFDNSFARLPDGFFAAQKPAPVAAPSLIAFNHALADELGITPGNDTDLARVFSGNTVPIGAEPLAQLYAGHQFGQYNPQLGDGRALLLGEVVDRLGRRRDIQLKGSGPTPFSRRGDGRAALGPVLREYVVSEAMHALGVPTTRALAAVRTGQEVIRERPLPGGVLTRVASSHIRVGTFQVFANRQDHGALRQLFDYTVDRHYAGVTNPGDLLRQVCAAQVALVSQWMCLGFIHGVMNTDNCTLSGETIDYGPCAYMDTYDPETVFSSIDRYGRYAYVAQPDIIVWNMAQLATALVPLMPDTDAAIEEFSTIIHAMPDQLRAAWITGFGAKIGLSDATPEDARLIGDFLQLMHDQQADFTNTFRALADGGARAQFTDPAAFDAWDTRWRKRLDSVAHDPTATMTQVNPVYIPRNHRIEEMIAASLEGDDTLFHRLNTVLANPYTVQNGAEDLRRPPLPNEVVQATYCGT